MLDNGSKKSMDDSTHREEATAYIPTAEVRDLPVRSRTAPQQSYEQTWRSKPESSVDGLDILAVLVSLLALAFAIATISPSLSWAARLQYTNQIIVIGFLLGIMNMAMLRTLPYLFLVLEQRLGPSSLQNYDGLLRWSPFSSQLSSIWRISITVSLFLPLALSVLYKRFTGGIGIQNLSSIDAHFSMTALPGLQNVSGSVVLGNSTAPFISAIQYAPVPDYTNYSDVPYGYNLLVISNESAAALDVPVANDIARLQAQLHGDEAYLLDTSARATVAKYNPTMQTSWQRNFAKFWTDYGIKAGLNWKSNYDGATYGMLNVGTPSSPFTSDIEMDNSVSKSMGHAQSKAPRGHVSDIR